MAEIIVTDFTEFKSALEDPQYDIVHLGADITFTNAGTIIPRSKTTVVIEGHGFTITDYNSLATGDMIRYQDASGGAASFTVRDVVWMGHNYYGVAYAPPNNNFSNFTLTLDNVTYIGPQPVYNRTGITYLKDSTISLERNGSTVNPQELGEVNRIIIQGKVNVNAETTTNRILWFLNPQSALTVEENAEFNVTALNTYMFTTDSNLPAMLFMAGSSTNIRTRFGLFATNSSTLHMASTFTLNAGASFTSTQTSRRDVPSFKCKDSLTLDPGSSLFISAETGGTSSLVYFSSRANLTFNDPKSVVLYNNGGKVFQFASGSAASPNTINIDTELLNMWTTAGTGDFDDTPTRAIAKDDESNITAEINTSTTATTAATSNISEGDTGYPMTNTTFNVMQAQVVSMGRLNIRLDPITDISETITGVTESLASLKASYTGTDLSGSASQSGAINLPISTPIAAGTEITFGSNWKFLTKYIKVISEGSVTITHLEKLYFITHSVPCKKSPIKRIKNDWYVEITDTRDGGNDWLLYAWIEAPLTYDVYTLDDALVLNTESTSDIMSSTPILVKRGEWTEQGAVTKITWPELEGFLLKLDPDYYYHAGKYLTNMYWEVSIEDTP